MNGVRGAGTTATGGQPRLSGRTRVIQARCGTSPVVGTGADLMVVGIAPARTIAVWGAVACVVVSPPRRTPVLFPRCPTVVPGHGPRRRVATPARATVTMTVSTTA